jgi:membrane protein DedA with SNARE-associated domain
MLGYTDSELVTLLTQYGYGMVFLLSVPEGPIVGALAGFLISLGIFNPIWATLVLMLGDAVGDALFYWIGTLFRSKKIPKWLGWFGIRDDNVHHFDHYFHQNDWKLILIAKTQAVGGAILFSAGFAKANFKKYMLYNVLGSFPKVILFLLIGFYFGEAFSEVDKVLTTVGLASFALALLLLGGYYALKRYLKTHAKELKNE